MPQGDLGALYSLLNNITIMKIKNYLFLLALIAFGFTSCSDDDEASTAQLNLNITGLQDLGSDYAYEGWIMVDGSPKSAGVFTVDANGSLSKSSFDIDESDLNSATAYILTIEPSPDNDPAPSDVHILAGDFSGKSASVSVAHGAALGTDFSNSAGGYILATPTDDDMSNEASGVWFIDNTSGSPMKGLDLPTLPTGWRYEGWAVIDGQPVSTGIFSTATQADENAQYSGSKAGPSFPGEDFLNNAPAGLSFPTDLRGGAIVVSVEPYPDNSAAPFVLKPLVGMVSNDLAVHSFATMGNNASTTNPTGSVSR